MTAAAPTHSPRRVGPCGCELRHVVLVVVLVLSALTIAGCGGGGAGDAQASGTTIPAQDEAARDASAPAGEQPVVPRAVSGGDALVVDVAGHVRVPGVDQLPAGSRVHEAIRAAGGARRGAQLALLNRAAPLVDGQQVLVAAPGPAGAGGAVSASGAGGAAAGGGSGGTPVSLNSADVAALDALPGIGPVTAQAIIDERSAGGPYASVDDLDRVSGVGPATIERLRSAVTP